MSGTCHFEKGVVKRLCGCMSIKVLLKSMQMLQNLCTELGDESGLVTFKQLVAALEGEEIDTSRHSGGPWASDVTGSSLTKPAASSLNLDVGRKSDSLRLVGSPASVTLPFGKTLGYAADDEGNTRHVDVMFESASKGTGTSGFGPNSAGDVPERSSANPLFRASDIGSLSSLESDVGAHAGMADSVENNSQRTQYDRPRMTVPWTATSRGGIIGKRATESYNPQQVSHTTDLDRLDRHEQREASLGMTTSRRSSPGMGVDFA